jgi:tRNA modification GTPase
VRIEPKTIAAIATPSGRGGIGIIKISGTEAFSIAGTIFRKASSRMQGDFESHRLYYGHIVNPETGLAYDEVLLVVMRAPRSYTGEDAVEIQAHSGYAVLGSILELVLRQGAKPAEPGEFTKRAFLNGRIDLTQAEAVMDIIAAKTSESLEIAAARIRGEIRTRVEAVRESLLGILTGIEAAIDFPDSVGEDGDTDDIIAILRHQVIDKLNALVRQYESARFLRDGFKVLIAGKPNTGKSSLMNCLLGKDRCLVSPVPGTTRDMIEDQLDIRGIPVTFADTAGLHETDDPVEILGIQKTKQAIDAADLILFITDISQPVTADDDMLYAAICHKKIILVANKSDLVSEDFQPEIPGNWNFGTAIKISALHNHGTERLMELIAETVTADAGDRTDTVVPNLRHKLAIDRSLEAASAAADGIENGIPSELVAIDIRDALNALGEIIGLCVTEDVLDQIFSRFCIGK